MKCWEEGLFPDAEGGAGGLGEHLCALGVCTFTMRIRSQFKKRHKHPQKVYSSGSQ